MLLVEVEVEVEAGELKLIDGNLVKSYGHHEHNVARQTRVQHAAMLNRLAESGLHAHVTGCVVLPDFRVEAARIVSFPRERIIDAAAAGQRARGCRVFTSSLWCTGGARRVSRT